MKNILSKTRTAIVLLLVTVIFLGIFTFMLTRPISYGMPYHDETAYDGIPFEVTWTFYSDSTVIIENPSFEVPEIDYYYYRDGYMFLLWVDSLEESQKLTEFIDETYENVEDIPLYPYELNAFTLTSDIIEDLEVILACKRLIVFTVFGGILAIALVVLTGRSMVLSAKERRRKKEAESAETTYKAIDVNSGYKEQQNLSFVQFLAETPAFVAVLVSAVLSRTLLVVVDLLDSFGNLLRTAMVTILSQKLSKDLRYEYNYGVGKIEALGSLVCDGLVLFGLLITLGLSVYSIIFPDPPSGLVIAVVGLKVVNVCFDTAFFVKQRKILNSHHSTVSETNYAAAFASLLFDSITLVSLFVMWLLRNNPIGGYISPVISIFVAVYLMLGCVKRAVRMLNELTDKTLPEEMQMKILSIMTRFYDSYSQFHTINSHKSGDITRIDLHLSFEKDTGIKEIVNLKKKMQEEFDRQIGNCIVNIIVSDN